ncbi:MAG: RDD family protein [Nostocaceae cyanobacterium]|nr:RDD family protein [Nostocaceae cyanobacterium]
MSYCINPNCPKPQNSQNSLFCQACGSELLLNSCYRVNRLLSDPSKPSGFGTIYEVDDNGTLKILKILHNTHPKAIELFQQEAEVLKRLNHPGIPRVELDGYFIYFPRNSQNSLHCLVMEKIEGMNLEEYLIASNQQPISERAALRWLKQIAEILHEVHQNQYFHRDIKPANIMLRPNGQLVLIDFGTAREVTQTYMQKVAGQQVTGIISAGYTPPEQMNGKAVVQSDFYALGRTFVYLLTGKHPHQFAEHPRTGKLIWRDYVNDISGNLLDFIDYLMAPFPGNRPKDTQEILVRIAELESIYKTGNPYNRSRKRTNNNTSYVGFWQRCIAHTIDISILTIAIAIVWKVILNATNTLPDDIINEVGELGFALLCAAFITIGGKIGGFILVMVALSDSTFPIEAIFIAASTELWKWIYFSYFESSHKQGTPGKMALGIVVTDLNQNRLSFAQANIRYWSKTLSALTILIGFIMSGFTKKKQALHDKIAETFVVKK